MEKESNIEYIEKSLVGLVEESLADLEKLKAVAEEMDGDPKILASKIELAGKTANIIDKLMSLERLKNPKKASNISTTINLDGAIFAQSTSKLLSTIEEQHYGINTRSSLYDESATIIPHDDE